MSNDQRITDLETRLTYLDDSVEQLNDVIVQQQKTIASMEKLLKKLAQEHVEMKEQMAPDIIDTKPPHY